MFSQAGYADAYPAFLLWDMIKNIFKFYSFETPVLTAASATAFATASCALLS